MHIFNPSRVRQISVNSRAAWPTNGVPGQPALLHKETLSQNNKTKNLHSILINSVILTHSEHSILSLISSNRHRNLFGCNGTFWSPCRHETRFLFSQFSDSGHHHYNYSKKELWISTTNTEQSNSIIIVNHRNPHRENVKAILCSLLLFWDRLWL